MNTSLNLDKFLPTGVGGLPFNEPKEACELVFDCLQKGIPFWPQLTKKNFKENMYVQYSQGLPGVAIDEPGQTIHINTSAQGYSGELEEAYEHYLADDLEFFAIGPDYAAGLYEFISRKPQIANHDIIKGQTIGPISFGLTVTDENKKAIVYNQEFRECMVKVLSSKTRWQIRKMKEVNPKARIVIFIDEPYLVSIGSSFFNIGQEQVINMLNEVIDGVHQEGAFAGIHCCGNTDWSIVLKTGIDILNFDACNYLETLFIYRQDLEKFINRSGIIAWGIVSNESQGALAGIKDMRRRLKPYSEYLHPSLITPSCGLSALTPWRAKEVLSLCAGLAEDLLPR